MPLPHRGQITTSRLEAWETPPGGTDPVVIARMDWRPQGPGGISPPAWVLTLLPDAHGYGPVVLGMLERDGTWSTTAETEGDARLVLQQSAAAVMHALERIRDVRLAFQARVDTAARSAGQQSLDL